MDWPWADISDIYRSPEVLRNMCRDGIVSEFRVRWLYVLIAKYFVDDDCELIRLFILFSSFFFKIHPIHVPTILPGT
jgi:hypothetical protein